MNSLNLDPQFVNAGGTAAGDFYPNETSLTGVGGTGILTDYLGTARLIPTMGALERIAITCIWKGTQNTDFATGSNWTDGTVPSSRDNIVFDAVPLQHCILDGPRTVGNIINNQSAYRLVTNGQQLTINGELLFSNGAQIDAGTDASTIVFSGASQQTIPAGSFYNNEVFNLTVNNPGNVVLSGIMNIKGTFTASSGQLDAISNSATLGFTGSTTQTINPDYLLNNQVFNLTVGNSSGVALQGNITIDGSVNLSSGAFSLLGNTLTFRNGNSPITRSTGTLTTAENTNFIFGTAGNTGGAAFTIPDGTFTASPTLNNLTINRTNSLTLGNQIISLRGVLLVSSGTLNTNSNLTLLSSASQTALIDGVGNGAVLGNLSMQRYLPSGFGYKYVSSPFQDAMVGGFAAEIDLNADFPAFYRYDENRDASGWMSYVDRQGYWFQWPDILQMQVPYPTRKP